MCRKTVCLIYSLIVFMPRLLLISAFSATNEIRMWIPIFNINFPRDRCRTSNFNIDLYINSLIFKVSLVLHDYKVVSYIKFISFVFYVALILESSECGRMLASSFTVRQFPCLSVKVMCINYIALAFSFHLISHYFMKLRLSCKE